MKTRRPLLTTLARWTGLPAGVRGTSAAPSAPGQAVRAEPQDRAPRPRGMLPRLAALAVAAGAVAAPAIVQAGVIVTAIAPSDWGASDAVLGLKAGSTIEDFEDLQLANGLTVTSSGAVVSSGPNYLSIGGYGPTHTLPGLFDPFADPFGNAFSTFPCGTAACSSLWDGRHALINTWNNQSMPYGFSPWGDLEFDFIGGATQVGFSLHQNEYAVKVYVNGVLATTIVGGGAGAARRGYFRIDATAGTLIDSVRLDGFEPDAWVVDHLAFSPQAGSEGGDVPEPASITLAALGLGAAWWGRRGRREPRRA